MGEVYLAQDLRLKRHVAVKYLRGDLPEGNWSDHLRQEALLLAQLNHPNIVQIYDLVEEQGQLALVMEYVEGRNLFLHLREHRVDMGERLRWLAEISAGLAASHEAGVAHCDLKAENVLISPSGTAKVNDFGIASEKSDPADDIAALGRLAESMLADFSHSLSPAMEELLAALISKKAAARPNASQVAERFRFAWYEYYQQETPLPEQIAPGREGKRNRQWLLMSALVLIAWAATLIALREPEPIRYVAIAPTEVVKSSSNTDSSDYLAEAITQTLRQTIIAADDVALTHYNAADIGDDLAEDDVIATLGADFLVTSRLDCTSAPCQLQVQRFDGESATRVFQRTFDLPEQTALGSRELIRSQWPTLFPKLDLPPEKDDIDESGYRAFLDLHLAHTRRTLPDSALFTELEALLTQAPGFAPIYRLYTEAALELYRQTASPMLLDRLEQRLSEAGERLAAPERLDLERFQLALARTDVNSASALKQQIIERGVDPALASYLQAEILFSSERYVEAMPYFAAATSVRPSIEYLRRQSSNAYLAGDLYEAQHALIVLQDLYPRNTLALDLLAGYQIATGRLDLAIATSERSLMLADSAQTRATLGIAHLLQGNYASARNALRSAYDANPDMTLTLLQFAESEELTGNRSAAHAMYKTVIERTEAGDPFLSPHAAALAYAHLGEAETAIELTRSQRRQTTDLRHTRAAALVYALLDMNVDALAKIEEAIEAGSRGHFFNLPWYDVLCNERQFIELMEQAGNDGRCIARPVDPAE